MFDAGLGTLVTYNPTVIPADATLDTIEGLLERLDIRHLPVVDGQRRVVGIVSLLDVQRVRADRANASSMADLRVYDLMKSPVVTVNSDDSPLAALQAMLNHSFHSVPVVTHEKLVGMVTSSDFLRELSHSDDPLLREPLVKHIVSEKAQIDAAASLLDAREMMDALAVDYLAVVNGGLPVGYVSRRDLVISARQDANELTCGRVASTYHKPAPGVPLTASLGDGVRTLLEKRAKVVLVVDRGNRCRGLLSVGAALAAIAQVMEHYLSEESSLALSMSSGNSS